MTTDRIVSWLLTYSLHSTVFLGLAWLIAGRLARRAPAAAEVVWRFALIAGLVTATLSSVSPWTPVGGAWKVRSAQAPHALALPHETERPLLVVAGGAADRSVLGSPPTFRLTSRADGLGPGLPLPASDRRSFATIEKPDPSSPSLRWQNALLAAWAFGVVLLLLGATRIVLGLRRRLQDRPRVVGGDLHAQLTDLAARANVRDVRLTCSSRVPVPLALGCVRPEICVPPRALAGLTAEQQEGMLAHELAHLVRRDPLWLIVTHLATCVGFFQPLNWLARRRLRELSELLADAWAVGRTGRPLSLAGCLAEVAGWTFGRRPILPAAAMADRPSHLKVRIQRLLEGKAGSGRVRRVVLGVGLGASLLIVLGAAPVVRSAADCSPSGSSVRPAGRTAELAIADSASSSRRSGEVRLEAVREEADPVQRPEPAVNEVAVEQGVAGGEDEAESDESSDESEEHCDSDAVSDGVEGGAHHHGDADELEDLDDAVDDAVEAAVDGAMSGVEASLSSLDSIGGSIDGLDGLEDALDVDVDVDIDDEIDHYTSDLDRMRAEGRLSAEEQRKMAHRMEELSRQMQQRLQPRIQKMSAEVARKVQASVANSAEMRHMAEEMSRKAAQMRPDRESQRRLEELAARFAADGRMSRQESERLAAESKRLAERVRLSAPELKELKEMARKQGELGRKIAMENRDEIEKAKREMRQAIEVEMKGVRKEIERQRSEMRERSRDDRKHQKERLDRERKERLEKEREERRDRDNN